MGKKPIIRKCNICGHFTKMTDDHVPPKCCKNRGNFKYYKLFENDIDDPEFKKRKSPHVYQNGIYFTTLCSKCNNKILGREYDPHLGKLVKQLDKLLNSVVKLPSEFSIVVKPNRVCRAIVGHLLAAFGEYNDTAEIEVLLRNYFIDITMDRIKNMYLYYWIHPYNNFFLIRNTGIYGDTILGNSIFSIIKFPPIAFMLSTNRINDGLKDFFTYTTSNLDDEVSVTIDTKSFVRPNGEIRSVAWPFVPNDNRIFIISENMKDQSVFTLDIT